MKKPEIDAYGWVNGKYYDDLSEVINPLIDALVGVHKIFGDEYKYDSSHRGAIMAKIKTVLRDVGANEEKS